MKKTLLTLLSLSVVYLTMSSYHLGPAMSGMNLTGSQGYTPTCSQGSCHTFSANTMVTITLDSAGNSVTSWVPGMTYTVKLHGTNTSNLAKFGFQFSAVKGVGVSQTQAGTFSSLPTNVHAQPVSGITVVEHGLQLNNTTAGVYDVQFSWTAPAAGAGTLTFYAILNAVNNNSSDNGDQFNFSNTQFTESTSGCPLPVVSTQPLADTVCVESPASFTVATTSTGVSYQWVKNGANISGATAATYTIPSVVTGSAGFYKCKLTNTCGTTISDSVKLTVNPLPVPTIIVAGNNLSTQTFSAYQWLKNNIIIGGATAQNYTATTPGSYRVKVTNANGCTDTSAITTVSVTEVGSKGNLRIYPNPAQSVLYVESDIAIDVQVRNIMGQIMKRRSNAGSIDISDLSNGIYFINVADKEGNLLQVEKISKQ